MPRMSIKGQGHILKRLMKIVFENYLWQFIAVIVCIVVTAYATIQSSTFTRDLVDVYIAGIMGGTKTMGDLANAMIPLGCVLALGVAASYIRQRLMGGFPAAALVDLLAVDVGIHGAEGNLAAVPLVGLALQISAGHTVQVQSAGGTHRVGHQRHRSVLLHGIAVFRRVAAVD